MPVWLIGFSSRWARKSFGAFPITGGMPGAEWVGNPVREPFWEFDRESLRDSAMVRYDMDPTVPNPWCLWRIVGSGCDQHRGCRASGSLGRVRVSGCAFDRGAELRIGELRESRFLGPVASGSVRRVDAPLLCNIRPGGGAGGWCRCRAHRYWHTFDSGTGEFGSSGHQVANARFLTKSGAAVTLVESKLGSLGDVIQETLFDEDRLASLQQASKSIARPGAALSIAESMIEAA